MTSYREGYCRICGAYSQGVHIDYPGLCAACAAKYGYPKSLQELKDQIQLTSNQHGIVPEGYTNA